MNFYYQPKIAAEVADWVNYVTPVPAAQAYVENVIKDPAVAHSPMVFPSPAMYAKASNYYVYKNYADFTHWNNIFNPIIQS